jgi:hypothetical protein
MSPAGTVRTSPGRSPQRRTSSGPTWPGRTPSGSTSPGRTPRGRAAALAATAAAAVLAAVCLLSGCADSVTGARPSRIGDMGPLGPPVPGAGRPGLTYPGGAWPGPGRGSKAAPGPRRALLPGVGPRTRAEIPADAGEVVLVSGAGRDSTTATVTFFRRDPVTGWAVAGRAWTAHDAVRGRAGRHRALGPRPPAGVFTLADARGRLSAPVVTTLLRTLDPALHPVIVMGDATALAR